MEAQASISVPSTEKCSVESRRLTCGSARIARRKPWAISPSSNRSRFLVNTVASHTGASIDRPTNQRNRWGGRPQRHRCATLWVVETTNRGTTHHEHYHDWLGYRQVRLPDPRRERGRKGRAQAQ